MRESRLYRILFIAFLTVVSLSVLYLGIKTWTNSRPGLESKRRLHMILQVDGSALREGEMADALDRILKIIQNRMDEFGVSEKLVQKQGGDRILVELPWSQDVERGRALIGQTAKLEFKLLETPESTATILKKIDEALAKADTSTLVNKDKARDETEKKGKEIKIAKDIFGEEKEGYKKGIFTQHLESSGPTSGGFWVTRDEKPEVEFLLCQPQVTGVIPGDDEFAWSTRAEIFQGQEYWGLYLLKKRVELSGKYLVDAKPRYDEYRKPELQFTLTKQGGKIFAQVTGDNINKPLAITLDGRVESAPIIRSKIRDSGIIELGGAATIEDATDLAIVLKAGAFPAAVKIIEIRVIDPSLEQDSVHA
jgi:SecD/SecF fusion protein